LNPFARAHTHTLQALLCIVIIAGSVTSTVFLVQSKVDSSDVQHCPPMTMVAYMFAYLVTVNLSVLGRFKTFYYLYLDDSYPRIPISSPTFYEGYTQSISSGLILLAPGRASEVSRVQPGSKSK